MKNVCITSPDLEPGTCADIPLRLRLRLIHYSNSTAREMPRPRYIKKKKSASLAPRLNKQISTSEWSNSPLGLGEVLCGYAANRSALAVHLRRSPSSCFFLCKYLNNLCTIQVSGTNWMVTEINASAQIEATMNALPSYPLE